MKKHNTLIFFFLMLLSIGLQAQDRVAKVIYQRWNAEDLFWQFQSEDAWEYNQNDQEVLFIHHDVFFSDFVPYNDRRIETKYNSFGNIIEIDNLYSGLGWDGEFEWENNNSLYSYNNEQVLTEIVSRYSHSEAEFLYGYKSVFERDENENSRSELLYRNSSMAEEWEFYQKVDSFFNENGCLTDFYRYNYDEEGSETNIYHYSMTTDEECQRLTFTMRKKNSNEDTLRFLNRFTYEYNELGNVVLYAQEKFNSSLNEFEIKRIEESDYDEEGRLLSEFNQYFNANIIDTSFIVYSYTSKGEVAIFKEYGSNTNAGFELSLERLDSFIYQYDDFDKLIQRKEFNFYSGSFQSNRTFDYVYYCNDQLKWEIRKEGGGSITRKVYEYKNEIGCELEETASPQLKVYPNPTSRILYIESNLLSTPNATLRIISMSGQEVYYKKMNKLGDQHRLELATIPTGHYTVLVTNDEETVSQMVLFIEP